MCRKIRVGVKKLEGKSHKAHSQREREREKGRERGGERGGMGEDREGRELEY